MKKINTLKQLRAEKKMLAQRRDELEKLIRLDWIELKKSMSPEKLFFKNNKAKEEKNGHTFFGNTLSQLAGNLTDMLVEKAESKFYKWFKK